MGPKILHRPGLIRPSGSAGPKSDFWAHRFYLSIHSRHAVYNSSEIDKIRYCQPNRGTGGPTARVTMCPENLHRPGLTTPCGLRRAKVGFLGPSVLSLGP